MACISDIIPCCFNIGVSEEVTDDEVKENKIFINAIMETKVHTHMHTHCIILNE